MDKFIQKQKLTSRKIITGHRLSRLNL